MGIEHSCRKCGAALGRIREQPDPIYRLPIIVCPACGVACVRRRDPLSVAHRRGIRMIAAVRAMAWRLGVGALLAVLTFVVTAMVSDSMHGLTLLELVRHTAGWEPLPDPIESWQNDNGPLLMCVGVGWFIGLGAAVTAGLGHVRRRWLVWAAMIGGLAGLGALGTITAAVNNASRATEEAGQSAAFGSQWRSDWPVFVLMGCGLAVMPVGMSIGRSLRRALAGRERQRWINKLARARKRRLAI